MCSTVQPATSVVTTPLATSAVTSLSASFTVTSSVAQSLDCIGSLRRFLILLPISGSAPPAVNQRNLREASNCADGAEDRIVSTASTARTASTATAFRAWQELTGSTRERSVEVGWGHRHKGELRIPITFASAYSG
jgi:hypothetical protein